MIYENERDVIAQLEAAGLVLMGAPEVGTLKPVRCEVGGRRGRPGWYWLSEFPIPGEDAVIITGAFGEWNGADRTTIAVAMPEKVCEACGTAMKRTIKKCPSCGATDLRTRELTKEQKAEIRRKAAERNKALEAARRAKEAKAAMRALRAWKACTDQPPADGCGYLDRKKVGAHGVRFSENGTLVVPITDVDGKIHGLQFIYDKANPEHKKFIARNDGGDKRCWPYGMGMHGGFHLLGRPPRRGETVAVVEGYATGASILESGAVDTVAVTFFANNILPALKILHAHYRGVRWLIAADDDFLCRCGADIDGTDDGHGHAKKCAHQVPVAEPVDAPPGDRKIVACSHCGKPHKKINTGVTKAMEAAFAIDGSRWIVPRFTERKNPKTGKPVKWSDFNDLHVEESLQAVETQVRAAIAELFPPAGSSGAPAPAGAQQLGDGEGGAPRLMNVDEAVDRYTLIYGVEGTMFDHALFKLVPKSCVLDNIPGRAWEDIKRHPFLRRVDIDNVGFDPTGRDTRVQCNMWGGWPTVAKPGECGKILALLEYLLSAEKNARDLYRFTLQWMAYQVQHPGTKMKSSLVFRGGQGAGKNMFWDIFMDLFGDYGTMIGQTDLEDKFNDWASRKLFIIANEAVARQERYHTKNALKELITGYRIRINPKNTAAHFERNHVNLVFLSNEVQPVVLEGDDRRYMVVKTPPRRPTDYYTAIAAERDAGGREALLHYLLEYDVGDFYPDMLPPDTGSKQDLIDLSKESPELFLDVWREAEGLDDADLHLTTLKIPWCKCSSTDLFTVYRQFCREINARYTHDLGSFISKLTNSGEVVKGLQPFQYSEEFKFLQDGDYTLGKSMKRARGVWPAGLEEDPDGKLTRQAWNSMNVLRFRRALERKGFDDE